MEFTYGRWGGLCVTPDGGVACSLEVVVREDGTWSASGAPLVDPAEGTVPQGAASELAALFDGGYEALTARPFRGTCPVAYDGSELIYRVRLLPTGPGAELADAAVREVRSCTHDLEHPRARVVVERIDEVWARLGLPR